MKTIRKYTLLTISGTLAGPLGTSTTYVFVGNQSSGTLYVLGTIFIYYKAWAPYIPKGSKLILEPWSFHDANFGCFTWVIKVISMSLFYKAFYIKYSIVHNLK